MGNATKPFSVHLQNIGNGKCDQNNPYAPAKFLNGKCDLHIPCTFAMENATNTIRMYLQNFAMGNATNSVRVYMQKFAIRNATNSYIMHLSLQH